MRTHLFLLVFILLLPRVQADPPAPKATLAQVLAAAPLRGSGTFLAVGADKTTLPDGATPPPPSTEIADCATAFGLTTQKFGGVTAIAPAAMTLLNDRPGDPDLSANVNPFEALQSLAASLDDSQWQALTSDLGLGLADLTDDDQRALFWALFPSKRLHIAPATPDGRPPAPEAASDVSNDLPQIRLRLGKSATLYPPTRSGKSIFMTVPADPPDAVPDWVVVRDKPTPRAQQYGVPVRADVPNALKLGDLVFSQPSLQMPIPVFGLRTVGDLIARVGQAANIEMYADPHYEKKTLTVLGDARTVQASDLLRALAVCVTGTFRRVGPAYVLTDDLPGIGAVHQTWSEFRDRTVSLKSKTADEAARTLFHHRSIYDLSAFGDPLAPTLEQEKPDPTTGMGHFLPQIPNTLPETPFSSLTPGQQDAARRIAAQIRARNAAEIAKDPSQAPDLSGKWVVSPLYTLQARLRGFRQPIDLQKSLLEMLVWPPEDVLKPLEPQMEAWDQEQSKKKPGKPVPPLTAMLRLTTHRAVIVDPRDADEVRDTVATMQKLGLNELWLCVFQGGAARFSNPVFPPSAGSENDLLAVALNATKGTGITVFPVLDLMNWGQSPSPAVQDVGVLGETSVQIDARRRLRWGSDMPQDGMSVSPFAPVAWTDLAGLVGAVASRPGIGGIVWRRIAPSGYDFPPGWQGLDTQMGYTPAARLAFLRRAHADPIDIVGGEGSGLDFHLPNWDDADVDNKADADWAAFRADTDRALLRSLYAVAEKAAPPGKALPIIVGENDWGDRFGTWDTPRLPPPILRSSRETDDAEPGNGINAAQAKAKSHLALAVIIVKADSYPDDVARWMDKDLSGKSWDGFALDIARADGGPGISGFRRLTGM